MNFILALNAVLAAVALGAVVCQIAHLSPSPRGAVGRLRWHVWALTLCLFALGLIGAVMAGLTSGHPPAVAQTFLLAGLAMNFLIRHRRRRGDA